MRLFQKYGHKTEKDRDKITSEMAKIKDTHMYNILQCGMKGHKNNTHKETTANYAEMHTKT